VNTPSFNFVRREKRRLGQDLTGYVTGESTDPTSNDAKKSKEPVIAEARSSGLKEITIMVPNLYLNLIEYNYPQRSHLGRARNGAATSYGRHW
jgi:hypothetical protein